MSKQINKMVNCYFKQRFFFSHTIFLFLAVSVLFHACNKREDTSLDLTPIDTADTTKVLYVAGYDRAGTAPYGRLWKNDTAFSIGSANAYTRFYSVFVSNKDVYLAGVDENKAKVWKNGVATSLSDGSTFTEALAVSVSGKDVYAAGQELNSNNIYVGKVWKNGVASLLTDGLTDCRVNSLFVSGNDVYVAGQHQQYAYPVLKVANLWINGNIVYLQHTTQSSEARSVFVKDGSVYVAGWYLPLGGTFLTPHRAIVWKNSVGSVLSDGRYEAQANAVFVSGNDVYVAGEESNGSKYIAKYWKNGTPLLLSDGTKDAVATSIFVNGADVYVVGYEMPDLYHSTAKLWKNGISIPIKDISGNSFSRAYSVFFK